VRLLKHEEPNCLCSRITRKWEAEENQPKPSTSLGETLPECATFRIERSVLKREKRKGVIHGAL
jgi:hypothetical protein